MNVVVSSDHTGLGLAQGLMTASDCSSKCLTLNLDQKIASTSCATWILRDGFALVCYMTLDNHIAGAFAPQRAAVNQTS